MSWFGETNPHFWSSKQPHTGPPIGPPRPAQQPPETVQHGRRIRPRGRPDHVPTPEPNPHFWPRDRRQAPLPPADPDQQTSGGIQPEKRIMPKEERPDQVQPREANPHLWPRDGQQSRPGAHEPELELIPTWPTRPEDQEGSGQPKKQQPRIGPTKTHPPQEQQPCVEHSLMYPPPSRTNPCTWFIAIFCVILWVVVILGGILILAIYLFYRPRNPHLEIANATLNAAYVDVGYLLNADLVVLVNLTNPNEKMNVDFNLAVLRLEYENQAIANQYIGPFSAPKSESKLTTLEMVSSQIRLPVLVAQQLVKQIRNNRITFQVEGYFHARSTLGGVFRYSYWLYSHCTIVTTGPPTGIMVASKCITKR